MAVEAQKVTPARAYLEYFRDLGVHDFYRNEDAGTWVATVPVESIVEAAPVVSLPVPNPPAPVAAPEPDIARPIPFNDLLPLPSTRIAPDARAAALKALQAEIGDCTRCPLAYAGRHTIVFGDGDPNARLMFIGEGPGADEDAQGLPFVGKSGQLLNNMIAAMGLKRESVYIANIVKCRPPANRAPEPIEASTCSPFLVRQIDIVQPEFIVALGSTAATYLLGVKQSLANLRGRFHPVRGAKAVITYHPAFLLRDPRMKGEAWKDLQMVMGAMGLKAKTPAQS
jgi:uracil-DNA glycosylase